MQLGGARESLESAYVINKRTPGNEMWEAPTHEIVRSKPQQVVYEKGKKQDRRNIISTPNPITRASETWQGRTSTTHRVMNYMEAGKIIAAAEKISHGHTQWARFCYDPLHDKACGLFLSDALFCAWAIGNKRKVRPNREQTYRDLALISIIDTRHRFITGKEKFSPGMICQMLGYKDAQAANWYRGMKQHFTLMYQILDQVDLDVVTQVSRTVNKMKQLDV